MRLRSRDRGRDRRGNVSIFVAVFMVVGMLLCTAVGKLGGAVVEKSRANNAADASALAAADGLALGWTSADACAAARSTAADNGARLLTCRSTASVGGGLAAEVVLQMHDATAQARAEVGASNPDEGGAAAR
jgi:secretion/DNA translocation related TadE-like protein